MFLYIYIYIIYNSIYNINTMQYLYIYDLSEWTVRLEEGWLGEKYVFGLWFVGEGRTRSPIFYVSLYREKNTHIYTVQYIV